MNRTTKSTIGTVSVSIALVASLWAFEDPADKSGGVYPNDFGPDKVDVSKYPRPVQLKYRLFASKCNACHTLARPINSQFVELNGTELAAAKKNEPELFKSPKIWHVESRIWERYVKRMMKKPESPVRGESGKKIYEFLVYDSKIRKTGARRNAWKTHRQKLLNSFQRNHPDDYRRVFSQ